VTGGQGEDLVEKQNAEQGLMLVVENEADIYGYIGEDRHMVDAFRHRRQPMETFHDGVAVAEMLLALYRSAEIGQTVSAAGAGDPRAAGGALVSTRIDA
jgi:predicted dehydrogenase